jgi:hypothetical protein
MYIVVRYKINLHSLRNWLEMPVSKACTNKFYIFRQCIHVYCIFIRARSRRKCQCHTLINRKYLTFFAFHSFKLSGMGGMNTSSHSQFLYYGCWTQLLSREATNTNFIVFSLIQSGFQPTIYGTRGEYANYYTSWWLGFPNKTYLHNLKHLKWHIVDFNVKQLSFHSMKNFFDFR